MYYSSGVYTGCPSNDLSQYYLNHAVILIGYDSSGNWIIKNQWGTGWG
jgi:C1A family cysteine protease